MAKTICALVLCAVLFSCYSCGLLKSRAGSDLPGLANFGAIANGKVCRSAQPEDPSGYQTFKQQGGKTVINLRDDRDEERMVANAGLIPRWFKLDADDPPAVGEIERIVEIMADPANQPILVHCRFGQDRTGLIIASYRIIKDRWTYNRAYEELKNYAFANVEIHRSIVRRLAEVASKYGR